MADQTSRAKLLAGDLLDVAFTLERNEHPEFGGIELSLRDFKATDVAQNALAAEGS